MGNEVDEHLVVASALKNLTAGRGIALQDGDKVLWSDFATLVVNLASLVHIDPRGSLIGRLVEELSREWVLAGGSNIVIGHGDDVICRNAIADKDL